MEVNCKFYFKLADYEYNYLKKNMPDMDVSVYLEQPGEEFSYLSGYSDIKNTLEEDKKFDVFIVLDCSSIDRIEPFARGFENADKTICIDHHISNNSFADVNQVVPDASSACEVLYDTLDDEKIEYINENMHNVVLSLDGRKEVNDNMRPTLNDKGSHDIILPKFKKLIETRPKDKYYYIRGTFTRENLDFSEDVMHFANEGFVLTSVEPVVGDESNPYALREEDMPKVFEEYENLAVKYADMLKEGKDFKFFHFMIDLNQGPCVIKRITGCGAGNEYLAITPEGDIYPCHQFVGNEDYKLSNIMNEEIVFPHDLTESFKNAHVYSKEDCKKCWNKFYCSGGCHANATNFNGDVMKPYELGCEMQKKRTECSIMIQAKLMLEGE